MLGGHFRVVLGHLPKVFTRIVLTLLFVYRKPPKSYNSSLWLLISQICTGVELVLSESIWTLTTSAFGSGTTTGRSIARVLTRKESPCSPTQLTKKKTLDSTREARPLKVVTKTSFILHQYKTPWQQPDTCMNNMSSYFNDYNASVLAIPAYFIRTYKFFDERSSVVCLLT